PLGLIGSYFYVCLGLTPQVNDFRPLGAFGLSPNLGKSTKEKFSLKVKKKNGNYLLLNLLLSKNTCKWLI
ncbi:MAG: hypothetical protein ACOCWC_05345, partial [Bacteroidota bacterium]